MNIKLTENAAKGIKLVRSALKKSRVFCSVKSYYQDSIIGCGPFSVVGVSSDTADSFYFEARVWGFSAFLAGSADMVDPIIYEEK